MAKNKILIVEDEAITAMCLANDLISIGFDVYDDNVFTGREAIEKALSLRPDAILMDIFLDDDIDGIEAVKAIHREVYIPVVYVTASSDATTFERAQTTRMAGFLRKPYTTNELQACLDRVFHKEQW